MTPASDLEQAEGHATVELIAGGAVLAYPYGQPGTEGEDGVVDVWVRTLEWTAGY